jgi:hypothetical protein
MSGGSSERQRFRREELFRLARLPNGEDDKGRADAIRVLHRLYLRQKKAEARALGIRVRIGLPPVSPGGRSAMVNSQLEDLFKGLGQRITQSKDPIKATRRLFQPKGRRGPRVKNAGRDLSIALEVQKLRNGGKTREKAIFEVAETKALDDEAVRRIVKEQDAAHGRTGIILLAGSGKTNFEEVKI